MPSDLLAWADQWWDEERGLLRNPPGSFDDHGMAPLSNHMVPQSAWYAVGCLARGMEGRAERIVAELTALQYDEPGTPWHGTFARFARWPRPVEGAVEWVDYDPNWRQFIGTTFRLMERTWGLDLRAPIELAVAGEPPDRVSPGYSNIALMKAWLEDDERFGRDVVARFEEHGAFEEYGSPTYYGIDLYALALWREHPPTPWFAEAGERVEAALWRDVARWYHPGLRNLCGPYSRAYGMDMTRHVALLGLWLPDPVHPDLDRQSIDHGHDLTMAPMIEVLGRRTEPLDSDHGLVSQRITDDRVATGWVGERAMLGGEDGGRWRAQGQYHPATAHWRHDDGTVGWARVRSPARLDAAVFEPGVLEVTGSDLTVETEGELPGVIDATDDGITIRLRA